ncbi:MAG TPA: four helix bundle protein [Isosphaeraceae bacterium]
MAIQNYHDLRVWQAGMDLVEQIYLLTARFPDRELYGLVSSMRRAAVAIPSNVAQGHTLETTKDYLYHISRAQGHLADLQTQVEIAGRLGYLPAEHVDRTLEQTVALAKQLYAPRNALLRNG